MVLKLVCPAQTLKNQETCGGNVGKEETASLEIFSEVDYVEHEQAFSATFFWVKSCWKGKCNKDMHRT